MNKINKSNIITITNIRGDMREGIVFVSNGRKILLCFCPNWTYERWFNKEDNKINQERINKRIELFLFLITNKIDLINNKDKCINQDEMEKNNIKLYQSIISGKIILQEEYGTDYTKNLVDCGYLINIIIPKEMNIRTNDYIKCVGRLDAKMEWDG